MLAMPIGRIAVIIDQAADVDSSSFDDENETEAADAAGRADEADDSADTALAEMLDDLTPEETYELLALALLGESENADQSWGAAVERAQAIDEDEALDRLVRSLVMTNAIEIGLNRLGYNLGENPEAERVEKDKAAETQGEEETG